MEYDFGSKTRLTQRTKMRVLSVSSDVSYLVKESRELQTKDLEIKFLIKMYT